MAERTAKGLVVELMYGPEKDALHELHPEDRGAAESLVDQIEAAGWRIVPSELAAVAGHVRHGEVLVERDLLRDALTHVLAAARDVDRNMRSVVDEKCDDCYRGPGEGHDEDCGMGPLAAACDYAVQLLRGRVSFELAPSNLGGTDG